MQAVTLSEAEKAKQLFFFLKHSHKDCVSLSSPPVLLLVVAIAIIINELSPATRQTTSSLLKNMFCIHTKVSNNFPFLKNQSP